MADDLPAIVTRLVDADEQAGQPVARSQWAPADCRCPWPWPLEGKHVHLDCPHFAPEPPARIAAMLDGCHQTDGTWIHGRPHECPKWARG